MLAYLLEYYSENSMIHIGWMINVTNILPDLSKLSNHDYYGIYFYFSLNYLYFFIKDANN